MRMNALIRGVLHIDPELIEDDEEFYKAWGQTRYYLETVHQVSFER